MMNVEFTRTIVGIVGNGISFGLFTSPIPTFVQIVKSKTVSEFVPDPYLATLLNCMVWIFYGLPIVHPDTLLVLTINGAGFVIELIYIIIFFIYANAEKRRKMAIVLLIEAAFMAVVVIVTLRLFHGPEDRSMIVGILAIIFCIIMYTAPLTIMRQVIRTKSVKYMPFFLSLANFLNGAVWTTYALLRFDPYVLVPNALGTLSGIVQLTLYATYYKSTDWSNGAKEVELPPV